DKSVLVTGAGRGLGLAMAERIGREGARVWMADIRADWGEPAAQQLRRNEIDAHFVECDVADAASVEAMATVVTGDGPLYGLVNNAALANNVGGKRFFEIDIDEW